MKLVQKSLLKGTLSFEIVDDQVIVRGKRPLKDAETLNVMLNVLNPEPVITDSSLDFVSRVNGEALVSLRLGKPDADSFNAFVAEMKRRAQAEYNAAFRIRSSDSQSDETPPEFADDGMRIRQKVDPDGVASSIEMLVAHVGGDAIPDLITALRGLQAAPEDGQAMAKVVAAFNGIGPRQGAVLTYAPYLSVLLSDDPFGIG